MARERLVENFSVSTSLIKKIPLNESNSKILYEGKEYITPFGFEAPMWDLSGKPNRNGRKYPRALGEKIQKEGGVWTGLADHPKDDEGSVKDIVLISKNPHIRDNKLFVDIYPVGEYKQKMLDIINIDGASLSFSSSGYGEVNRDGTVDESSYSLERALDWVLNNSEPVATVFAENAIEESTQNSESQPNNLNETINISEDNDNDNNNDNEEIKEGKKSMDNKKKVFSFEEKNFRLTVSKLLKEAEEIEDPLEKKDELEDIKEWFEDVDFAPELKQEVEDKLDAVETEIKENAKKGLKTDELSESQKTLKKQVLELSENYTSLDEKFEKATEMLDNMKAYGLKMKELYENQRAKNNGMITAKEYKEAVDYVDTLEKKLKENNEAMKKLSTENKSLRESVDGLKKDLDKKAILEKARLDQINVTKKFNEEKQKANIAKEASNMLEQAKKELVEKEVTSINVRQTDAVKNYYLDLLESNDNYSEYKNQILGCKTILEAQTFVMKLNSSNLVENKKSLKTPIVNVNVSLKENVENDTEEYVFNRKEIRENYKSMSEIMVKGYI